MNLPLTARCQFLLMLLSVLMANENVAVGQIPVGHFTDVKPVLADAAHRDFRGVTSADGLTLFFANANDRGSGAQDLWMATRSDTEEPFVDIVSLGPGVNSSAFEDVGSVSRDGQTLYFSSNRTGKWQSYQATQIDGSFGNVMSLGPGVNANVEADTPNVSDNGLTLYYHRADNLFSPDEQVRIWKATRPLTSALFGDAEDLGDDLNGPPGSTFEQWYPSISRDETVLFFSDVTFASSPPRPGGQGSADIWVSTRATRDDPFGMPVNINELWPGSEINTASGDVSPDISPDWPARGSKLYFVRREDIYQATWIPEPGPGDFDGDGDTDGDDFLIWQTSFGLDDGGDADGDSDTDGDDFLIWQSEFGSGSSSVGVVLPEPASIVLLHVLTTGGLLSIRRWEV